jgi:hypothetical protein
MKETVHELATIKPLKSQLALVSWQLYLSNTLWQSTLHFAQPIAQVFQLLFSG